MIEADTERKIEADAPVPEHIEIPNDDTVIIADGAEDTGVDTQSPSETKDVEADEPQSMLDAVQKDLEGKSSDPVADTKAEPEAAKDGDQPGTGDAKEEFEFLKEDVSEEETKDYSKKAQARIRQLVEQRNGASEKSEAVAPILDFLTENDIPQQDLDIVLNLTAQLRHGDFAGFLNGVRPYVDLAMQYTGQTLPADLQAQVEQGFVSPEVAKELSQRRIEGQRHKDETVQRTARDEQNVHKERATSIRQAVTNWETQQRATDPDYGVKEDMIRRTAQAYMQEKGVPTSVEQAIGYVKDAYDEVNTQMGKIRPQRAATLAQPNGSVTKGGTTPKAEPASFMEAAMQGLNAARG